MSKNIQAGTRVFIPDSCLEGIVIADNEEAEGRQVYYVRISNGLAMPYFENEIEELEDV